MTKIIDISEHNGNIDFNKVKQDGIKAVIIRIGWIGNKENHTLDKKFYEYVEGCKNAGLPYGVYVYSYCKSIMSIESGVKWILNQLSLISYKASFPIFLDMEDESILECGKENLTNQCISFCNRIELNGNYTAGIYANLNWFTNYLDINRLETYKIWLAQYTKSTNHSAKFKVDLWQYTSQGKINGIVGNVDINKCLNCENINIGEITGESTNKEEFEVKLYQNGSTVEPVYQDKLCLNQIGYLHPNEQAECYGIVDNKALIVYNVDNSNNKKVGFVKWLGGIK